MDKAKKTYETPTLTCHGQVEEITQATYRVGTGDVFTQQQSVRGRRGRGRRRRPRPDLFAGSG